MQLSSGSHIPDGLLAANVLLSEKPRLGVPSWNPALHQGINEANCTAAIGLRASESLNRVRSRSTGKERDTESGLDYFGARYYASSMGRWMSPDWADKPEAVPYSDLANPQSLNLYGFVNNNPLSKVDADGHETGIGESGGSEKQAEHVGAAVSKAEEAVSKFAAAHPFLTNLGVQAALMVITSGESEGGVSMPRLTEGGEAVPSAPSAGAAQREVMRQEGVPTSQQPSSQQNVTNSKGESVGRQYTYKDSNGNTKIVQRNNGTDSSHPGQPHVEGGSPKANGQNDSLGRPRLDSNKTKVNVNKPNGQ